ncbi:MAG TPA: S1/P1 nuclease [Acidobacteriaceae bacterium]
MRLLGFATVALLLTSAQQAFAWGSDGHRMIAHAAAATLPADVPAFLYTPQAISTLEYLAVEPDERWKQGDAEPELNTAQTPEHFIDLEWADLTGPLPRRRYDFTRALDAAQKAHPEMAASLTAEKVGLQPWVTNEVWERLKAAFREYRKETAAKQDTHTVEMTIIFYSGWLSHYVGDGSQPLHTTIQYNGWTGPNPKEYSTDHHIHAQFESAFVHANVVRGDFQSLIPAKPAPIGDEFDDYMVYLRHSNSLVEQTYVLYKAGGFTGTGTPEGKAFAEERLAAGAAKLRDMIYAAWVQSAAPVREYVSPDAKVPRPAETAK